MVTRAPMVFPLCGVCRRAGHWTSDCPALLWRRRLSAGVVALLWLTAALLESLAPAPALAVTRADFGTGIIIGVISIVGGLFGLFKGRAPDNIGPALFSLRGSVVELGKKLAGFIHEAGQVFARIAGALLRFYQGFIAPLIGKLAGILARISSILNRILGPIIRAVKNLRGWLLKFYDKVLRPIFDTIAAVRAILKILGKLGVDAAEKLDDALAGLEDKIRGPYLALLGKTNEIIDWLNRIVTLDGLLQRVTLLASTWAYRAELVNQWYHAQYRPSTSAEIARDRTAVDAIPPRERAAELRTYLRFGEGPNAARIRELSAELRRLLLRGA